MDQTPVSLFDCWHLVKKRKSFVLGVVVAATLGAILVSLVLPKTYKASAVIMPLGGQKAGGLAAVAAQMGLGNLPNVGGNGNSSQIMAILKSRTIAEKIINQYRLLEVFLKEAAQNPTAVEDGLGRFKKQITFAEDKKNQTVSISAELENPQLASDVVNGIVQELSRHIGRNTFTTAKRNRIFIEGQLERNKFELLSAGKELASFYTTNRVSNATPMVNVDVAIKKDPESEPSSPGVPPVNDPVLDQLQKQLDSVNQQIGDSAVVSNVPQQVYLQYLTLRQELLGKVNALLTQQYEMAKVEENKEDLAFQVIDWARVPVRKFKPKRAQMVIVTFILSLISASLYVCCSHYLKSRMPTDSPLA